TLKTSDQQFVADLTKTEEILDLQGPSKLFRPPGGWIRSSQARLAQERGYRVVLGSAYPYDPAHPPTAYIRWLVSKNLAPGVIVILHDGIADPSHMLGALEAILAAGEQKGFRFVTIGDLVGHSKSQASSGERPNSRMQLMSCTEAGRIRRWLIFI